MDDIDASERGEVRVKPTTTQEAFEIYKRDHGPLRWRGGRFGTTPEIYVHSTT